MNAFKSKVLVPNRVAEVTGRERETSESESAIALLRRCGGLQSIESRAEAEDLVPLPVQNLTMDFSTMERNPPMIIECAGPLVHQALKLIPSLDVICGVPVGGLVLAQALATITNRRYVFLEVPQKLVFDRHHIEHGETVALVQDQFEGAALVEATSEVGQHGGTVTAIFCFYNDSGRDIFGGVPIFSLVKKVSREG
jgi:adenine/guanine phosphoribosyltransferase-like PRPP-binding protein